MRRGFLALLMLWPLVPQVRAVAADERDQPDPVGVWRGELQRGETDASRPLQLVLRIRHDNGGYSATLDGLGKDLHNLKVQTLILVEDVLSFQLPEASVRFAGNFYGDSLRGNWSEGQTSRTLIFFRD